MRRSDALFRGLTVCNSLLLLAVFVAIRGGWLRFADLTPKAAPSPLPLLSIGNEESTHGTESSAPSQKAGVLNEYGSLEWDIPKPTTLMPGSKSITGVMPTEVVEQILSGDILPERNTKTKSKPTSGPEIAIFNQGGDEPLLGSASPLLWDSPNSLNWADFMSDPVVAPEVISSKSGPVIPQDALSRFLGSPFRVHFNRAVESQTQSPSLQD